MASRDLHQEGQQPAAKAQQGRDISQRLAEMDKVVQSLRESINTLAQSMEEKAGSPEEQAGADQRREEQPRGEAPQARATEQRAEPRAEEGQKPEAGKAERGEEHPKAEAKEKEQPKPEAKEKVQPKAEAKQKEQPKAEAKAPEGARREEGEEEEEEKEEEKGRAEEQPEVEAKTAEGEQEAPEAKREEEQHEEPEAKEQPAPEELEEEEAEERVALFEGTEESAKTWEKVGSGELEFRDDELHLRDSGTDRGLVYYTARQFDDFRLRIEYKLDAPDAPMSTAVRFLNPEHPVPEGENPETKYQYDNQAYVAVHTGLEVRMGTGPGGEAGTFVGIAIGDGPDAQRHAGKAELKTNDWNELQIEVRGNEYAVQLNGVETARFTNQDAKRGCPASEAEGAGYIGLLLGAERQKGSTSGQHGRGASSGRSTMRSASRGLPTGVGGPLVPRRAPPRRPARAAGEEKEEKEETRPAAKGSGRQMDIRRIDIETFGESAQGAESSGQTDEKAAKRERKEEKREKKEEKREKKHNLKLSPRDREALHDEVIATIARLDVKNPGTEAELKESYGYAVFPSVGRASLLLGGARGYGEVFEHGKSIGWARLTQVTLGVQVGGQTFSELVKFGSKESLTGFRTSPLAFNANASAAFIGGASGTTNFKDVTARAYSRGGMLLEASLGGQKFRFYPKEEVAAQAGPRENESESHEEASESSEDDAEPHEEKSKKAKKHASTEEHPLKNAMGEVGRATKGFATALASKVRGLRKHKST